MLTERDKKALRFAAQHPFLARRVVWVLPVVFLGIAGAQLYVAAHLANLTLMETVRLWFAGLEPGSTYSGILVSAIVRVERALGMFCVGVAFAGLAAVATVLRGREQRLCAARSIYREEGINA